MFNHFAADAPVGVPVQQHRLSGRLGSSKGAVQRGGGGDGLPGTDTTGLVAWATVGDVGLGQRAQWIGLPAEGAVPAGQGVKQQGQTE
ncbi:hypothetical protein D3C78_772280 [compost metagenome]